MGAGNVAAALTIWCPRLGRFHAARVALLVMANTTLDTDAEPTYWGGQELIAHALGLAGSHETNRKRVSEAIKVLVDAGALTVVSRGYQGRRSNYRLNLSPVAEFTVVAAGQRTRRSQGTRPGDGDATRPEDTDALAPKTRTVLPLSSGHLGETKEPQGKQKDSFQDLVGDVTWPVPA